MLCLVHRMGLYAHDSVGSLEMFGNAVKAEDNEIGGMDRGLVQWRSVAAAAVRLCIGARRV